MMNWCPLSLSGMVKLPILLRRWINVAIAMSFCDMEPRFPGAVCSTKQNIPPGTTSHLLVILVLFVLFILFILRALGILLLCALGALLVSLTICVIALRA